MLYHGKVIEDADPETFRQSQNPVVHPILERQHRRSPFSKEAKMQLHKNEIMTGPPGCRDRGPRSFLFWSCSAHRDFFRPLVTYKIYVDNAAGIKQGAVVMLAGRKIGQVQKLFSPVSREEERRAEEAAATFQPEEPGVSPTPSMANQSTRRASNVQVDRMRSFIGTQRRV
jgi:hypothetical protein